MLKRMRSRSDRIVPAAAETIMWVVKGTPRSLRASMNESCLIASLSRYTPGGHRYVIRFLLPGRRLRPHGASPSLPDGDLRKSNHREARPAQKRADLPDCRW